jgi:hypothetical protein
MSETFDPYREWLGLESPQPLNHYQLLGVAEFEPDMQCIVAAADTRMAQVRTYQTGPRGKYTQKILNELASAKLCLVDPKSRAAYDAALLKARTPFATLAPPLSIAAPPVSPPPGYLRPPQPPASGHEQEVDDGLAATRWWLPLGIFFALVIVGTVVVGAIFLWRRPPPSKVIVQTPVEETTPMEPTVDDAPLEGAELVFQEASGDLNLPTGVAELLGGVQREERGGETLLTTWSDPEAAARWRFKLVKPAIFQVQLVYAAQATGAAQWALAVGEDVKVRDISPGETTDKFVTDEFFWKISQAGEQELTLRAVHFPSDGKLLLKSIRFSKQAAGRVK